MSEPLLMRLARDLEWLGCELEYQGKKHAEEGFPKLVPRGRNLFACKEVWSRPSTNSSGR